MFEKAIANAMRYTCPIVITFRRANGNTGSSIGTFIVLNEDGWILTASHVIEKIIEIENEVKLYSDFMQKKFKIQSNQKLTRAKKKSAIKKLTKPLSKNSITSFAIWLGRNDWHIETYEGSKLGDLAVGQIKNFDRNSISVYPEFKNPNTNLNVGKSLCKLGFPFHSIKPIYDENNNSFHVPPESLPITYFPIEGIFTRTLVEKQNPQIKFIETSSPGLQGQSGGPTFDTDGRIWAMQSKTKHYYLGFSPVVPNQQYREHQFINCGIGTHVETIIQFLNHRNIKFNLSNN